MKKLIIICGRIFAASLLLIIPAALCFDKETFSLFPIGKSATDVRVPQYSKSDELVSLIHTETLIKETDELLQMDGFTLVMFEDDQTMKMRLKTAKAHFDLTDGRLRSRTKTFIQHQQFDMQGDSLLFNTETGKGTLKGNVEMVIYSMNTALPVKAAAAAVDKANKSNDKDPNP